MAHPGAKERMVDIRDRLDEMDRLGDRLTPGGNRADVFERLDALFAAGVAPDPSPAGFHAGRLLGTSTWAPWDAVVARIAQAWMPWQGKTFSPSTGTGLNRFTPSAVTRASLRALFPRHSPEVLRPDRIEAFPFRICVGRAEIDPGVKVMKIDYDFEANPALVRHILDELVQVAPGRYLGKILFRSGGRYRRIGYFSLGASAPTVP